MPEHGIQQHGRIGAYQKMRKRKKKITEIRVKFGSGKS